MKASSSSLERQRLLVQIVHQYFNRATPKNGVIEIDLRTLMREDSLSDFVVFKKTLDAVPENVFTHNVLNRAVIKSAAEFDSYGSMPYAVKFYVDDPDALADYQRELHRELKKVQGDITRHHFLLDGVLLFLAGSKKEPYKMERAGFRYKILHYLARSKKQVTTQKLAADLTANDTDRVRKTIGEIRTEVHKKFNVPREAIIQNTRGAGYSAANIEVKQPTRDTP